MLLISAATVWYDIFNFYRFHAGTKLKLFKLGKILLTRTSRT